MESGFLLEELRKYKEYIISFYPCFNGIRVLTMLKDVISYDEIKGFYPCFNGIRVLTLFPIRIEAKDMVVSILVLMESGFLLKSLPNDGVYAWAFLSLF